jgi:predicted negative regulator of RcsB-dependent stress response
LAFLAGTWLALAGTPANLEEALAAQRALVAEHPQDVGLINDLGNLLALAGKTEEAEETYFQALAIQPDNLSALYNLALVQQQKGEDKEARKTLTRLLELDPQHAWGHYQMGTLYLESRNRTKALHHYAAAFATDPSLTSPKVNPHIVENQLATEALLQVYVNESTASKAPRIYENPGTVADLLLPSAASEPAPEDAVETAPEAATGVESTRSRAVYESPAPADSSVDDGAAYEPETTAAGDEAAPRTLDASSLRERPAGTSSSTMPSDQSLGGTAAAPRSSPPSNTQSRPTPVTPSRSYRSGSTAVESPTSSTGGFTPGLQSTGSLEIELLPASDSEPSASST